MERKSDQKVRGVDRGRDGGFDCLGAGGFFMAGAPVLCESFAQVLARSGGGVGIRNGLRITNVTG